MQYLIPSDYEFQFRDDIQAELDNGSTTRLRKAEKAAVAIFKDRLSTRFAIDEILIPVKKWNAELQITTGDLIYYKDEQDTEEEYMIYEAVQNSIGEIPKSNTDYFVESFRRNPMIIMYLVDVVVFHYHAADTQGAMPEEVEERQKQAMKYIDMAGAGMKDTSLPQRKELPEKNDHDIRYWSHPVENQRY